MKLIGGEICKGDNVILTADENADLLDNYFKACHQADEYRQSMNFDDEIETFLRKVSNRMATLDDITPKVMEWIEKEEFKTKIGLSIK